MPGIDDVFARMANDAAFADAVRERPVEALRGYDLSAADLRRLDAAVRRDGANVGELFNVPASPTAPTTGAARSGTGLLVGGIAAVAGLGAFGAGAAGWLGGGSNDPAPQAAGLRPDVAAYFDCSADDAEGARIGDLRRGDEVWLIGRSGDTWLVIRNPDDLTTPAWMRRADLETPGGAAAIDGAALPELTCNQAIDEAAAPTTQPTDTDPAGTDPAGTDPASTDVTTPTDETTTTTQPTTTVGPTVPSDTTGPTVSVTPDRTYLLDGVRNCPDQTLDLTVIANDPSNPVTITTVTWSRGSRSGAAEPLGGSRYRIPRQDTAAPDIGFEPLTITATAVDGVGNATAQSVTVEYRIDFGVCIVG